MKYIFFLSLTFAIFFDTKNIHAQNFNFDEEYMENEANDDFDFFPQSQKEIEVYDPWEGLNRKVFAFNELLDKKIALPIIRGYQEYIPKKIRDSIHNFANNIYAPITIINSILQGDGENAMASFSSFIINSTVGFLGFFDVAGNKKIIFHEEDFGQTFGHYGMGNGPYLVIPILGPSNLRDFSGFAIEKATNPIELNLFKIGGEEEFVNTETSVIITTSSATSKREALVDIVDDIRKNSFDVYATMRSAYTQNRKSAILNE